MPYIRFGLSKPADLVVPSAIPLSLKRPKVDGITLDSLKSLAQETTLCVYLAHNDLVPRTILQSLSAAVANQSLKPIDVKLELLGLYRGKGSRILQGAELRTPPSPPSYDELGESPAPYSSKTRAAKACNSRKRPRVNSSDLSEDEPDKNRADRQNKPAISPGAYVEKRSAYDDLLRFQDDFVRFRDEFQQMKTRVRELELDSQQMRAELATTKKTATVTDSQEIAETTKESPTPSQHMRTRLGVYSKAEVEDLVYDGTLDTIAREGLCNQADIAAQFEEFEDNFDGCTKSEVETKLEMEKAQDTEHLAKELEDYFCDNDDVEAILDREMRNVYTKDEVDTRLYEVQQSCEGINRIETEDLILDARHDLEKDLVDEISVAKADLRKWTQNVVRLEMLGMKTTVRKAVRVRMQKRRLSHMTHWRKFHRERMIVLPTVLSTSAATLASSTASLASPTAESTQESPPS
ncbi:hypothetical protein VMCG_02732 [Cytospora schulzeri]|uniref:Uncharacterized protein n=1 Tax=Cytospora schulzeri TaxID=448051 RepID=A0A423WZL0_9PEZI|nr:hypothetical protein VMCG_02732 [Valsa malicola]